MTGGRMPEITKIIKSREKDIKDILSSTELDITTKTVLLRRIGREIAVSFVGSMAYPSLEDFFAAYDRGEDALTRLEGEGTRHDSILVLNHCPMMALFNDFKESGDFPDYWKSVPDQYMETFKNEAILHPLCIVHQRFRDELTAKIPKGKFFVHSIAVACRSMASGKVVYSKIGLKISDSSEESVNTIIEGKACAFQLK